MMEPTATPDHTKHHELPVVRVYIPSRTILIGMVVCTLFFIGMMAQSAWEALNNPDPTYIVFVCFWGGWTILSVFCVAALHRMRIFTSSTIVQVVDLFRTRTIILAEVTRAVWRAWPPGIPCLVLHGSFGRVVVGFKNYVNGMALVWFFRNAIPQEVQDRYEQFETTHVPSSVAYKHAHHRERDPWWESKWTLIALVWIWFIAILSLGIFRVFPWLIVAATVATMILVVAYASLTNYILIYIYMKYHRISCPRCSASMTDRDLHSMPTESQFCPHCNQKLDSSS